MYNLSGDDDEDTGGGGEGGDGGEAGGGQPGAGDGESENGGEHPPEGVAPVPGGGLDLEVGWFLAFPMPVSNPCSVMIGRIVSKELDGEEGDGVSVHWYTPTRKNPCRRSSYGKGSWSPDFVFDSNNKRVADIGIESASAACSTFRCLLASGKLPAAVWVAVEENVEPSSEAEEGEDEEEDEEKDEELGERPPTNAGGRGAAGSATLELPSRTLKVRKTAAAFKPSRHTTRNYYG